MIARSEAGDNHAARCGEEASVIWVGAALIIAGLVAMVLQPLRQGQLSGDRLGWEEPADTLEPRRPSRGLGIRGN
jgi:hypothetical protein